MKSSPVPQAARQKYTRAYCFNETVLCDNERGETNRERARMAGILQDQSRGLFVNFYPPVRSLGLD